MMIPFQCSKSAAAAILISLGLSGKIYCSGERDMPADESTVTLSMMQMQSAAIKSRRSSVELNEGHEETETDMQHDGRHDRKSQGLQEGKDEALTSLQSLVEQWEFKAQKGNLTQTPQQRQQLQDTIDLLANTFQQKLLNESKEDQRTYELKKDQHNACINHKNRRFDNASGDIIAAKNLTEEKKQKHKACRKMQQSLAHLQDDAKIIGDKPWADMVVDHDHSLPSELQSMCPNKDTFKQDLQDYRNAPPANHVSSSCTDDQGSVESQFCAWLGAKTWACQAFDECIDAVDLQGEKDYRKSRESNRKALWLTIQKLKCRLNHILAAFPNASHDASHFNQTDNCSNTPASEPWELTLNMTVPDHESCTTVGEKEPSTTDTTKCQEWQNDHYPDLLTDTQNEYASVDDCQQDCLAPPPDLIGIPDHCIDADVSDDCAFYQRHRDACGKYHTDASENCCACIHDEVCTTVIDPPETSRQYSFDSRRRQSMSSPAHSTLSYDGVGRPAPGDTSIPPSPEYVGWDTTYQAPSQATLRIDLGATRTISGLMMYNLHILPGAGDGPYTVDSSTNMNDWTAVGTFNLIDIPTRTRGAVQFANHETARYIRITTIGVVLNVGVMVCPQAP